MAVEVSAFSGEGVNELFERLALIILTKIELGEIDPDDPNSGIQYGDSWDGGDGISVRSGVSSNDLGGLRKRGKRRGTLGTTGWREWEDVFRLDGRRRRGAGCYC